VQREDETPCQAGFRDVSRRAVVKAEILPPDPNTRFVVTNRTEYPEALYDLC
jgi:hypothetical protein